jgi:hypothetical protein
LTSLVMDSLETELVQDIEIYKDMSIKGIKLKLYFHQSPPGTFYLRFYKDASVIKEYSFISSNIKSQIGTLNNYFHAVVALVGDFMLPRGNIQIKLESSGYSYSNSSFIGWCKDYDKVDERFTGTSNDFTSHPYEFKLIEYIERTDL